MKKHLLLALAGLLLFSQSCLAVVPIEDTAFYYTDSTLAVSGNMIKDKKQMKIGTSQAIDIMHLVTLGDAGIKSACRDGEINKIYSIEQKNSSVYFFYKKYITKVYGE